jgi:DNA invertase Pin-like site-specific DNA recombinase
MQEDWKDLPLYRAALKYKVTARTIQRWRKRGFRPERQNYSEDFKQFALSEAKAIGAIPTCKKLGIAKDTIYNWIREKRGGG